MSEDYAHMRKVRHVQVHNYNCGTTVGGLSKLTFATSQEPSRHLRCCIACGADAETLQQSCRSSRRHMLHATNQVMHRTKCQDPNDVQVGLRISEKLDAFLDDALPYELQSTQHTVTLDVADVRDAVVACIMDTDAGVPPLMYVLQCLGLLRF